MCYLGQHPVITPQALPFENRESFLPLTETGYIIGLVKYSALADAKESHLIDATKLLANTEANGCEYFFDICHQNAAARDLLNQWLLPQIETWLYSAEARH